MRRYWTIISLLFTKWVRSIGPQFRAYLSISEVEYIHKPATLEMNVALGNGSRLPTSPPYTMKRPFQAGLKRPETTLI